VYRNDTPQSPPGWLVKALRFVDMRLAQAEPPGQVELNLYNRDADSPRTWVSKHSSEGDRSFFPRAREITDTTVASHAAVAFEWDAGPVVHAIAFFLDSLAIVIEWWATSDSNYAPTVASVFGRMLASYRDPSASGSSPPAVASPRPASSPSA
jgi:hypothetical protein